MVATSIATVFVIRDCDKPEIKCMNKSKSKDRKQNSSQDLSSNGQPSTTYSSHDGHYKLDWGIWLKRLVVIILNIISLHVCIYPVSNANGRVCINQYTKQLLNVNTVMKSNNTSTNVHRSEVLYGELPSLSVRGTLVNKGHYNAHNDLGKLGHFTTQVTPSPYHPY